MGKPYRAGSGVVAKREVYEVDEIHRVLEACPDSPTGNRDRFAVMLLWCTGLKPGELLALNPQDYTWGLVRVGKREVVVPGGQREQLADLHTAWQVHRASVATARSPLLCSLKGGALDTSYLRHMFAALKDEAKLEKRLHAQGMRNTFAAAMHRAGVPMEIVRRQLGLSDLEYTAGIVAAVAPVGQEKAMEMETFSLE